MSSNPTVSSVPEHAWRKFHRITPVSQAGALWVILAITLFNFLQNFSWETVTDIGSSIRDVSMVSVLIVLGALLLLTLLVIVFGIISWKFMSYAVVESGIHMRQGIFIKQHQHTRWDRIQSVEIEQKLFGRVFGFGSVVVEAAGSGESGTKLGLLRMEDCGLLRQEILTGLYRARAGLPVTSGGSHVEMNPSPIEANAMARASTSNQSGDSEGKKSPAGTEIPGSRKDLAGQQAADEIPIFDPDDMETDRLIFDLPTGRLLGSTLLTAPAILSMLSIIAFVILSTFAGEAVPGMLVFLVTLAWSFARSLFGQYNTRVFLSENGLRHRSGLTKLITKTIPPHRIHGIKIDQPLLWRLKGWWRLEVSMAGVDASSSEDLFKRLYLCPVGSRTDVERLLWTILPSLGTDQDAELLQEAFAGRGAGRFFVPTVRRARWLDPMQWTGRGLALTPHVFIAREGRFTRSIYISPQDRNQSLKLRQGPVQRRLALATLEMNMVVGTTFDVRAKNFDENFLEEALWKQSELTAAARNIGVTESLEEWRQRVGV